MNPLAPSSLWRGERAQTQRTRWWVGPWVHSLPSLLAVPEAVAADVVEAARQAVIAAGTTAAEESANNTTTTSKGICRRNAYPALMIWSWGSSLLDITWEVGGSMYRSPRPNGCLRLPKPQRRWGKTAEGLHQRKIWCAQCDSLAKGKLLAMTDWLNILRLLLGKLTRAAWMMMAFKVAPTWRRHRHMLGGHCWCIYRTLLQSNRAIYLWRKRTESFMIVRSGEKRYMI